MNMVQGKQTPVSRVPERVMSLFKLALVTIRGLGRYEWSIAGSVAAYASVFSIYLIEKYEFFRTGYFDFGSSVQQAWLVSHGQVSTFVLGRPINLVVGALYWLVPRPETLLVFQSLMLAIGAVPLYALTLKELQRKWYGLVVSTLYLTSAFVWGVNQYEYHDLAMIVPLFLFSAYFYANGNMISYLGSLLLALFSSELVVLIGTFLALSFALDYLKSREKRILHFTTATLIAVLVWAVYLQLSVYIPHYSFATLPASGYTLLGSTSFLSPSAALANPGASISYAWANKYEYLAYLFGALMFLPLLSLRKLLPAVPWLAVVVAYSPAVGGGGIGPVYQLYSNWSSFLIPFIFVAGVYGLKRFCSGSKDPEADATRFRQVFGLMLIVSLSITMTTGAFSPVSTPVNLSGGDSTVPTNLDPNVAYHGVWPTPVSNYTILDSFVSIIPKNDTVLTQNVIGSKLAERAPPVYIFYQPGYKNVQADAILTDTNVDGLCSSCMMTILGTGNYTLYGSYDEGGINLYFRT